MTFVEALALAELDQIGEAMAQCSDPVPDILAILRIARTRPRPWQVDPAVHLLGLHLVRDLRRLRKLANRTALRAVMGWPISPRRMARIDELRDRIARLQDALETLNART